MFKFSKNTVYLIGIIILFSKMFACADSGGGGCIPLELIPEGYRAQQYQNENPVLTNTTQVRITPDGFNYVKDNIGEIIKAIMPGMYTDPDENGNPRIKFCMPPTYGVYDYYLGDVDYGAGSKCSGSDCNTCYDHAGSCQNTLRCSDGTIGQDLYITILQDSIVIEPRDEAGTDADLIYGSVALEISTIDFWADASAFSGHTECKMNIVNSIPVTMDIDFTINTLNPAETSFDLKNINYSVTEEDLDTSCDSSTVELILSLVKGMIIDQITPMIDEMIQSLSDTLLCARTIPIDDDDLTLGFQCPMNAPGSASAGVGCTVPEDCDDGYDCEAGYCKIDIACNLYDPEDPNTESHKCELGFCDKTTGKCVVSPYCMETADTCWKQKLGMDGRIDIMGIISSFIETTSHSWMNFYLNLGHYAKAQSNGLTLGILAGTSSDFNPCVTPSTKEFNKIIPEITMFNSNELDGSPYHVGLGISEYFINQLLDSAYNGGALCLDIDSKISSMITTDLFGLLIPSINDLTSKVNSALLIAIRPQKALFVNIGPGNINADGDIIINEALLNIKINDLDLDFYAFLNDRYVRIFTTTIDLNIGMNLEVDGEGKLIPVLAPIEFSTEDKLGALSNLRVLNSEILRETDAEIAELLPDVVELAMGMLPLNFDPIALPSFMGFGVKIKENGIVNIIEGNDDETKNFIGIFADILIGVETPQGIAPQNITLNNVILEKKTIPRIKELRKGKKVEYIFKINSDNNSEIEYQYRINKGFWTPFKKGNTVKVNNPILRLQGKYNIDIRARKVGNTSSLSAITTKTVIVDAISPKISMKESKNAINITAKDNITNNVKYFVSVNNSPYKEYNKSPEIKIPENQKSILIKVKTIDESGNESIMNKRFNLDNRKLLDNSSLQKKKEETGCSYGGNSNKSVFIVFLIAIIALFGRKKNFILLLLASFTMFFYGCSDNTQKGSCKTDKECERGQICVEDICITGDRCEEGSEEYKCQDCYIPGSCTEPTGDNPCLEGCECNTTFGQCFPIDDYCVKDEDCGNDYVCKDNICSPKRCENDNDCAYLAPDCTDDHSSPICNYAGACTCSLPCNGGCPTGKFCCLSESNEDYNQCLINPVACEGETCEPGYSVNVTDKGSIDKEVSCARVDVICECLENPHLKLGTIGLFSSSAIWNDGTTNRIIITGYNSLYGDLVLGLYDESKETLDKEHITWSFIDGVLNDGEDSAEITNGPTGPRGGISQKGIDVGQYTSVAVDTENKIHISYYDKEHKSLRYAVVTKHDNAGDTTDTQQWDVDVTTVDLGNEDKDTGYYTSITLDNNNNPTITYMTRVYKDGNDYKSSLNAATLQGDSWVITELESDVIDLPCNNSCSTGERCLFDEEAVLFCETNLRTVEFNSINNNLTITDNTPSGITSLITVPSDSLANEFRVSYSITHDAAGQLKVILISPEGREYLLVDAVTDPATIDNPTPDGILVVNKKLNQIKNIDIAGVWSLKVIDTKMNIQGQLNNWKITIKTKVDNSQYCGATCQTTQENCDPACSSMGSEVCASDGICKKEAKEVTAKYYINGVGLFNKSLKSGNNIGILYYDSINGNLKYIHYKPSNMHIIENKLIDTGKVGRNSNFITINDNAHITYRDKAGNLRYLEYTPGTSPSQSLIIDDGLRITDGKYSIHKIGSDSLIVENGINEYDIYYYDATSREILFKHYKKATNEIDNEPTVFQKENEDATYEGSFGFYLNHLKLDNQDLFTTFYYRTQASQKVDAGYSSIEKPGSLGKVRVIKK